MQLASAPPYPITVKNAVSFSQVTWALASKEISEQMKPMNIDLFINVFFLAIQN
jgi:hypothetical protein